MVTKRSASSNQNTNSHASNMLLEAFQLQQNQHNAQALKLYQKILKIEPLNFNAHHMLGVIFASEKQYGQALQHFEIAISQQKNENIHANIAWLAFLCQDMELLFQHTTALQKITGDTSNVHRLYARYHLFNRNLTSALSHAKKAAEIEPNNTKSLTLLYKIQVANGIFEDTINALEKLAKKKAPHNKKILSPLASLCMQADIHMPQNPEPFFRKAQSILNPFTLSHDKKDAARAEAYLGQLSEIKGEPHKVNLTHFQRAFNLCPEETSYALGLAFALLKEKKWKDGFSLYDQRRKLASMQAKFAKYPHVPHINVIDDLSSSTLHKKHVAVLAEQGIGDCIQFMRFAPLLKKFNTASISLHVPPALKILAQSLKGIDNVVTDGDSLPHVDVLIPTMSLPAVLNIKDNDSINTLHPYLSHVPSQHQNPLLSLQNTNPHAFKVGVTWQGNNQYSNDDRRSIPLSLFQQLFTNIPATFYALHKNPTEEFLSIAKNHPNLVDLSNIIQDFNDTACIMQQLDLVISVDTSVIHAAGALGVNAWLLLAQSSDWRWHHDKQSSWYPSVHIFRYKKHWKDLIPSIKKQLSSLIQDNKPSEKPQTQHLHAQVAALIQTQQWEQAEKIAHDLAIIKQDDPHVDNLLAIIASQKNNLENTILFLKSGIQKCLLTPEHLSSPEILLAHSMMTQNLGNAYISLNQHDDAWDVFKNAIQKDLINSQILQTAVEYFYHKEDLLLLIKKKRRKFPKNFALPQASLRIFLFQNKLSDAITLLKLIDKNTPPPHSTPLDLPWPQHSLWAEAGRIAHLASQHSDASLYFENAHKLQPLNPLHIINTGASLALSGDTNKAIRFFKKQLAQNYNINVAAELSTLLIAQKHFHDAKKIAEYALSLQPNHQKFLEIISLLPKNSSSSPIP
jgi:tetratricopeptide (TPR) repeat protein